MAVTGTGLFILYFSACLKTTQQLKKRQGGVDAFEFTQIGREVSEADIPIGFSEDCGCVFGCAQTVDSFVTATIVIRIIPNEIKYLILFRIFIDSYYCL